MVVTCSRLDEPAYVVEVLTRGQVCRLGIHAVCHLERTAYVDRSLEAEGVAGVCFLDDEFSHDTHSFLATAFPAVTILSIIII